MRVDLVEDSKASFVLVLLLFAVQSIARKFDLGSTLNSRSTITSLQYYWGQGVIIMRCAVV